MKNTNRQNRLSLADVVEILGEFKFIPHSVLVSTDKNKTVNGICDPNKKEIYITGGLWLPDKRETIIHELLHAREFIQFGTSSEKRVTSYTLQTIEVLYGKRQ